MDRLGVVSWCGATLWQSLMSKVSVCVIDDATGSNVIPRRFICVPIGASSKQVEDVTCNYLAAHPEIRQMAGPGIVHNALLAAWPCSQKK